MLPGLPRRRRRFGLLWFLYLPFAIVVAGVVIYATTAYRDYIEELIAEADGSSRVRPVREGGPSDRSSDDVDQLARDLENAAKLAAGDDAEIAEAAGAEMRTFQEAKERFDKAVGQAAEAGWGEASGLETEEHIEDREARINAVLRENDRLTEVLRNMPAGFRRRLESAGVDATRVDAALTKHMPESRTQLVLKIRAQDRELCEAWLEALDLLRKEWGRWHIDDDGNLRFEDANAAIRHGACLTRIHVIRKRQRDLQAELRGD